MLDLTPFISGAKKCLNSMMRCRARSSVHPTFTMFKTILFACAIAATSVSAWEGCGLAGLPCCNPDTYGPGSGPCEPGKGLECVGKCNRVCKPVRTPSLTH